MIEHQNPPQTTLEPPRTLRKRGRDYWQMVVAAVELQESDLALLRAACEMLDRADAARRLVRRKGLLIDDRFGIAKANPAVAIERDALNAFRQLQRELCLADVPPDSRPAGAPRGYR